MKLISALVLLISGIVCSEILDKLGKPNLNITTNLNLKETWGVMKQEDVLAAYTKYFKIAGSLLKVAAGPVGQGAAIFLQALKLIVEESENDNIWEQVQGNVRSAIRKEFTQSAFGPRLQVPLRGFYFRSKKGKSFDEDDMDFIFRHQPYFFPQDDPTTTYTEAYASSIKAWMYYAVAGLLTLQAKGELDKCALARELVKWRPEIKMAAKALYQKRFAVLRGKLRSKYTNPELYAIEDPVLPDMTCLNVAKNLSRTCYKGAKWGKSLKTVVNQFVADFNNYTTDDFTRGCPKVDLISMDDLHWSYPRECYGEMKNPEKDGECDLPCDFWGDDYLWCMKDVNEENKSGNYGECVQPIFQVCFPVETTKMAVFTKEWNPPEKTKAKKLKSKKRAKKMQLHVSTT